MFKRRRRSEQDFAEEIASHLAIESDDLQAEGLSDVEATRRARVTFSNPALAQERFRLRHRVRWLDDLTRDLRFGLRQLRRSPGFAATAIVTLAIGLGANTAIFSLVNALLVRPLPVPHAEQLAILSMHRSDFDGPNYSFNAPIVRALEGHNEVFEHLAASFNTSVQVRSSSGNQKISALLASGQFFETFETPPLLGRYLVPSDDQMNGSASGQAVVISEGFWHAWFQGSRDVINRKLIIANEPFTVVGVMPGEFVGTDPTRRPSIFLPLSAEPIVDAPFNMIASGYHANWLNVIGRRLPGISLQQANSALQVSTMPLVEGADADWLKDARDNHMRFVAEAGSKGFTYFRLGFKKPLMVVLCLCGTVLLLACLNLTSLLMARAAARKRELATRLAIGATRRRLIQQLLIESFVMTSMGTAAGLLVSPLISRALAALLLSRDPDTFLDTSLDWRVFLFAAFLTMFAALLVGLIPALRATSGDLNDQIKIGSHTRSVQEKRSLLPRVLLGSEVGLALMLVIGAGLLAASLTRLYRVGLGFDPKGLVSLELNMDKQSLEGEALLNWYQQFADSLRHQRGVKSVSYESMAPLSGSTSTNTVRTPMSGGDQPVYANNVAPEYFATMRIPLLAGRDFNWHDTPSSGKKVILNESAAKILFPGHNALGEVVTDFDKTQSEVIAVVGDAKYALISKPSPPTIYSAMTQSQQKKWSYTGVIRIDGSAELFAATARSIASTMAPEIPAPILTTTSRQIDNQLSAERMMAILSIFFAICALLVTAIGLYGTLSYATARRTSEIGIRIALGAQRLQVVLLVFYENAWCTAIGSIAGLVAALLTSRALSSFLYGTSSRDPWILLSSVAVLTVIASSASLLPAIRAAKIDPIRALRAE